MTAADKPPSDLAPRGRGRRFWRSILKTYELRPDELELLAEGCRMLDLVEALRVEVAEAGVTLSGSRGQPITNPALVELRQQRQELRLLLARLDLPDETGESSSSRQGRHLAEVRHGA